MIQFDRKKAAQKLSNKWQTDKEFRARMVEIQRKQGYRSYGSTISSTPKERRKIKYPTLSEYLQRRYSSSEYAEDTLVDW